MEYNNILNAEFIDRPNRFIANILVDNQKQICHVKNTGRCKELLTHRAEIYVQQSNNPQRKTKYDLIAVQKGSRLVNMDSQAPNAVVGEWLTQKEPFGKITYLKAEHKYKNSRFDFYFETEAQRAFVEVKGVTLENDNIVSFPDAPSERAVKHLKELMEALDEGYKCYVIFVVQMKDVLYFTPNYENHREFAETLKLADEKGVRVFAVDCYVTPASITAGDRVEVRY